MPRIEPLFAGLMLVLAVAFAIAPAHAQERSGWATARQAIGAELNVRTNEALLRQSDQDRAIALNGANNGASIVQRGDANVGSIHQAGANNAAGIRQIGRNNAANVSQVGDNHIACLIQIGRGLNAELAQVGEGQSAGIVQTNLGDHEAPPELCAMNPNSRAFLSRALVRRLRR